MKKKNQRKIIITFLLILSLFTIISTTNAGTINVPGDHTTIEAAVSAAGLSDTIVLDPLSGPFTLSDQITITGKTITIESKGPEKAVIDLQNDKRAFFVDDYGATLILKSITIINGHVDKDYPKENGGAIYNFGGTLELYDCTFTSNKADNEGGAIYNEEGTIDLSACIFDGNSATYAGGAISNIKGTVTSNGVCKFNDNYVTMYNGGAIYNEGGAIELTGPTSFTHNSAIGLGGAIYNDPSGTVTLDTCYFDANLANMGGAIANDNLLELHACTFTSNEADNDGGAIYNGMDSHANLDGCTFTSNKADNDGGAIYNEKSGTGTTIVTLDDCTFNDNTATNYGGAIFNGIKGDVTLDDCEFNGNTAVKGGAFYNNGGSVGFTTGTFTDPTTIYGLLREISGSGDEGAGEVEVVVDSLGKFIIKIYDANKVLLLEEVVHEFSSATETLAVGFLLNDPRYIIEATPVLEDDDAWTFTPVIDGEVKVVSKLKTPTPSKPVTPNIPVGTTTPNIPVGTTTPTIPSGTTTFTTSDENVTNTTPSKNVTPTTPKEEKLENSYVEDDDVENSVGAANIVTMKHTGIPIIAIILIVLSLLGVGIFRKR